MAARRAWKGTISVAPGAPPIPVEAHPLSKSAARKDGAIKTLCACHTVPIDGSHKCRETGEPITNKVKGVERADGTFAVVDDTELEAIKEQVATGEFRAAAYEPLADCPIDSNAGCYSLHEQKDSAGFKPWLRALCDMLREDERALVGQITMGDSTPIVAVYAHGATLRMAKLRFANELYGDHPQANLSNATAPAAATLNMLREFAAMNPDHADYANLRDEGQALREQVVERILGGGVIEAPATATAQGEPDLAAQLEAAMAAKKAKAAPATAKARVQA